MQIEQLSVQSWQRTNATNYSTSGYPTRIPTLVTPAGDGVIPFGHDGGLTSLNLLLLLYGVGSSTNTFSFKILGWAPTKFNVGVPLWVPTVMMIGQATLGTGAGIAGADVDATGLFATTITCSVGPTFVTTGAAPIIPDWFQVSPGSNDIGMVVCRSFGFRFLEVIFTTGGSATSCNALWRKM